MKTKTTFTWLVGFLAFVGVAMRPAIAWQQEQEKPGSRAAVKERVAELLDLLEEQNKGPDRFRDAWMLTLKELVDAGADAVPSLIEELDKTDDDMMLRCAGFCLRAIGDKRAVPALIRAIPKTLRKPGSDMGLRSDSKELADFMRKNDLDKDDRDDSLGFGRPVREVIGAITTITGHSFEDEQLYHIFMDGTQRQKQMKEALFHRHAKKWADWWEANAAKQLPDEAYYKVNLPPREAKPEIKLAKGKLQHYQTEGGSSNWLLEPFSNPEADAVFFDFDTGRVSKLPAKWRGDKKLSSKFAEIEKWATEEGFDLMGSDFISPVTGKTHFAIRPLGLAAWELGEDRWKMQSTDVTFESLISEGKSVSSWLLHRNQDEMKFEPEKIATFLFRTKEGTPGLLFIGIEVHDDGLKAGVPSGSDDHELSPIAFNKGRRFAYTFFEEIESK